MTDHAPDAAAQKRSGMASFLAWFPWEKTLIWGLFLLMVYVLRDFFFVIFMTFMIVYIMSDLVRRATRVLSPSRERVWLQRVVSVVGFALLLGFLYGVGSFLYHPLRRQAEDLVNYARKVNVDSVFKDILRRTIGAWQFESHYRKEGEEKKRRDFQEFRDKFYPKQEYDAFQKEIDQYLKDFREKQIDIEGEERFRELEFQEKDHTALLSWLVEKGAADEYEKNRARRIKDWEENRESQWIVVKYPGASLEEARKHPEYEVDRDRAIKAQIADEMLKADRERYVARFKLELGEQAFARLEREDLLEDRFKTYYEGLKASALRPPQYEYHRFQRLRAAAKDSRDAFEFELNSQETKEEREQRIWNKFRNREETRFVEETTHPEKGDLAFLQLENVKSWLARRAPTFTQWIGNAGIYLFKLVVQFSLSLLLSFFITFDLPRLRRGIHRLEQSRISDFYFEIAPGLISFGWLIGRAFQAQGFIALCNTLLTFAAIKFLGIQNEIFLCSIVFICSFIPVLGVVLSSVPIAIMAIIQPGGDYVLALKAIAAILVVHLIETSFLNPKIVGDMLHLHPVLVLGILAVGEYFFGVWGLLLGVPVAVYIIRYVILAEDMRLSPDAAAAVVKVTGLREPPPRVDRPRTSVAPEGPAMPPGERILGRER